MTYDLNQPQPAPQQIPETEPAEDPNILEAKKSARLGSLDAYRGFVMLAMAASGLAFASSLGKHPEILEQYKGTSFDSAWRWIWESLAYQFSHVAWVGCTFWDMIQPSFMFMVGVSMPFSYSRRSLMGQSKVRLLGHAFVRSLILVFLGVFLSSQRGGFVNFSFANVLAQIGLGYTFLYLLNGKRLQVQLAAAVVILGGYWFYFYQYEIPPTEQTQLTQYLETNVLEGKNEEQVKLETGQFEGIASHWNKHTNAAAAVDRKFLNLFPRNEKKFNDQKFWINSGGYQTFNFIPSLGTMIFGLMAGSLLRSGRKQSEILKYFLQAGLVCLIIPMALDTKIWPVEIAGMDWSLCPTVKKIWTPTWAVFCTGWCLWMLGAFYWIIDIKGYQRWAFFLKIVGMNSIAFYVMSQLIKGWAGNMLEIWMRTWDAIITMYTAYDSFAADFIFNSEFEYAQILEYIARVFVLWLIALWMYRRKLFIRI